MPPFRAARARRFARTEGPPHRRGRVGADKSERRLAFDRGDGVDREVSAVHSTPLQSINARSINVGQLTPGPIGQLLLKIVDKKAVVPVVLCGTACEIEEASYLLPVHLLSALVVAAFQGEPAVADQ